GMVTLRFCCQAVAPSTAAASYTSRGISCSPARYSTKLNPMVHQTVAMAMPIITVFGLERIPARGSMPTSVAGSDHSPEGGVKMKTQIREIGAAGMMDGRQNARRKNHCARDVRLVSTASTKDSTTSGGTV